MSNKQRQQKNKKQQQRLEMEEGEDKNTHTEKSIEEKATNELERMEDDEEEVEEKEEKDTVMQSEEEEDDDDDDDDDELPTFHKGLKFRNYRPRDPDLEKYMLEKVVVPNLSKEISDKLTRLENAKDDDDIISYAPRKRNWDLKRDLKPRLDKLERRTMKAIDDLLREKILAEEEEEEEEEEEQ